MVRKSLRRTYAACVGLSVAAALFVGGCTPKITEEQLQTIQKLRTEEAELNASSKKKEAEKARIESEISARRSALNDCTTKKNFVQEKLAQWPNVWEPEFTPAPPPAPEPAPVAEPAKKSKKRK